MRGALALTQAAMCAAAPWRRGRAYTGVMIPRDSTPGADGKHAALYVSLHQGENRPSLDGQVAAVLARLVEHGYLVEQARLYGDVDGPLTGPRRRQVLRFLAAVGRYRLNGSVAFTTTHPDDRAFLVTAARHHGVTYTEAAAQVTGHSPEHLRIIVDGEHDGTSRSHG